MPNALCPADKTPGRRVPLVTVRSLVLAGHAAAVDGRTWFFCGLPDCDVVYFTGDGSVLGKSALKVRVSLKEKESPRTVCYCFGHTVESIREEIERTGRTTVAASIKEKVAAGECACETMNPKGACCLGDVNRAVREALAAIATTRAASMRPVGASRTADHQCCTSSVRAARAAPADFRDPELESDEENAGHK